MNMRSFLLPAIALLAAFGSLRAEAAPRKLQLRKTSFSQDWSRYPSPDSILSTLQAQFPFASVNSMTTECMVVTSDNRSILGESSPLTGAPSVKNPNSSFVVWYVGCLKEFIKADYYQFATQYSQAKPTERETVVKDYLTERNLRLCPINTQDSYPSAPNCEWTQLTPAARISIIESEIERMIGPDEVVRDLKLGASTSELASRIDTKMTDIISKNPDAFSFINVSFKSQKPSSVQAVSAVRFLILLVDTLKY